MSKVLLNNVSGNKVTETIEFVLEECCNCGIPFFLPSYHQKRLINNPGESFYCPNGHSQHYTGKTDSQKKIEELEKKVANERLAYESMTNTMLDERNKSRKLKTQLNRVHKGVCPCCNRTFSQLANHMKNKHPQYDESKI